MYGGDKFQYPTSHKLGMQVPRGGSMCKNCLFLGKDHKTCTQQEWVKWNGGNDELPFPDENYCCDLYQPDKILRKVK